MNRPVDKSILKKSYETTNTRKRFREGYLASEKCLKIIEFVIPYVPVKFLFHRVSCAVAHKGSKQ